MRRHKTVEEPLPKVGRDIPAHIEDIWINDETCMVTLRITTGGYRGDYGSYREKRIDVVVVLQGKDLY